MPLFDTVQWSFTTSVLVFTFAALAIAAGGTRLAAVVDRLADVTGMGEAMAGAILLGASTSLSGSVLSVTAALNNRPELAMGNALGGIAAQTAFLTVADAFYRKANLEHAAASAANMMQGALLVTLLSILLLGAYSPEVTFWGVHPATFILLSAYAYGITLVRSARITPMWRPEETSQTRPDLPGNQPGKKSLLRLWVEFGVLAFTIGLAGWVLEHAAANISRQTGLGDEVVGTLFTSVSTSLPELITTIAAVRRGALTLAVGGIVGGNSFDTLFAAFSDMAFRGGSIYHHIGDRLLFWLALSILMTGVLMIGLIRREERGIGRMGLESFIILCLYAGGVILLLFG